MKKAVNLISVLVLTWTAMTTGVQAGTGGSGYGVEDGTGPRQTILSGEPGTVSGTVAEVGSAGQGYLVDTGTEMVTLYGIGPVSYWDSLGVTPPQIYEEISAEVYWVTFSDGTVKAIAVSITVDGNEVLLRDELTGQPLWRSSGGGQSAGTGQAGGSGVRDGSCLTQ